MRTAIALTGLATLAACSTPGIDYAATIVPPHTAAVETRTVDVGRFSGPAGNWYADRFEAMLASATLDGAPWFSIARYSDGYVPDGQRAGIYEGITNIESYEAEEYTRTVNKCVEWDGLFDCEHRHEVEEICLREEVDVSVTPRLVEYGTGRVLFSETYYGSSSHESCDEAYWHGRRGKRHHGGWSYGMIGGVEPPFDMVRDALSDTVYKVRNDIAPRNSTMRATFVDEAVDPAVRADPRFEQAVKAGRDEPYLSCAVWKDLKLEYPNAPAVTHNLGACYESAGDFLGAHSLYAEAASQSAAMSGTGTPMKDFSQALARMSSYRTGQELLDRLMRDESEWQSVAPAEDQAGS
ncbi:MAG: hypothetical protein WA989_04460 [Henriciella sp.]|uniref:hypothetical protein n=1 Tax=Henriciella sp. TaxID=1968823 RepID=UPI003C72B7D6